ncbi:Tango6 family protein [Abortiporus biennis]
MQSNELLSVLSFASLLSGSQRTKDSTAPDLRTILISRLVQYDHARGREPRERQGSLREVEEETAEEALNVVQNIQDLLLSDESNLIGSRDLSYIRTLLSLVFKWSLEPLLQHIYLEIPSTTPASTKRASIKTIDTTSISRSYHTLSLRLHVLFHLVLPQGVQGRFALTHITTTIIDRHLPELLKPSLVLGWLSKSLATESVKPLDSIRPLVIHLLTILTVSQAITSLSAVLAASDLPSYARKACGFLLGRQILRRDGVRGMFSALYSEEEQSGDDAPLEKLEQVSQLLIYVPSGIKEPVYYQNVIPQLLDIITSDNAPPIHKRSAAFSISRMLTYVHKSNSSTSSSSSSPSRILLPILHRPFLETLTGSFNLTLSTPPETGEQPVTSLTPNSSLKILQIILTNTDPSPTLISTLLTPIIPSLYTLLYKLESLKTSDPSMLSSVRGLILTWGRIVETKEGVASLWLIIDGEGGNWKVGLDGEITRVEVDESMNDKALGLFTPQTPKEAEDSGEFDPIDNNLLNLRPDPKHFIQFLKSFNRDDDISSEIFVRLLEAYQESKRDEDSDPMRTLLYLQLIIQIQTQLSSSSTSSSSSTAPNILKKPDHILSFIKQALETAFSDKEKDKASKEKNGRRHDIRVNRGLRMEDLKIVDEIDEDEAYEEFEEGDSDDEDVVEDDEGEGGTKKNSDEEMTSTAISLLLSILEANPDLSAGTTPILNDIYSLLEPLTKEPLSSSPTSAASPTSIRAIAREARMVMTARLASSSITSSSTSHSKRTLSAGDEEEEDKSTEIYQQALKLLQDPILPVRAHGLLLLRELFSSSANENASSKGKKPKGKRRINEALIPGILSIFLQSIQDDDSYIYLNAVQGLAAMVHGPSSSVSSVTSTSSREGYGKEVLRGLVREYSNGLGLAGGGVIGKMSKDELDVKIRIGEALGQVIRRCGDILPDYASIIIPTLLSIFHSSNIPTTLRTSSLSLLAQCSTTNSLALIPYAIDLINGVVDLLQMESVPLVERKKEDKPPEPERKENKDTEEGEGKQSGKVDEEEEDQPPQAQPTMDAQPTSTNSKFPPLRRSALHFLTLLIQSYTSQLLSSSASASSYPSSLSPPFSLSGVSGLGGMGIPIPMEVLKRAKNTVSYVSVTDEDMVVRVMAREVLERFDELLEAFIGI